MERPAFQEIMTFLEGAYSKAFSERSINQAWKLCALLPEPLVKQAAVRMVDENEKHPSPKKLMERIRAIEAEAYQDRFVPPARPVKEQRPFSAGSRSVARLRLSEERDEDRVLYLGSLIGTTDKDGTAQRDDCLEYVGLLLARPYPAGHILAGKA